MVKTIQLDALNWKSASDFYDAVYDSLSDPQALPLPHRFGQSIDALIDVMIIGDMADLEPPYAIRIVNAAGCPAEVQSYIREAAEVITRQGRDINVSIEIE